MPSARSATSASAAEEAGPLAGFSGFQDESNGPLVGEVDIHHGLKNTRLHPESFLSNQRDQMVEELRGQSRLLGPVKARPPSLSRRTRQGELGDGQDLSARLRQRSAYFAFIVGEDAELRRLSGQELGVLAGIALLDTHEKADPRTDPPGRPSLHLDPSLFNSLQNDNHPRLTSTPVDFDGYIFYHMGSKQGVGYGSPQS